MTEAYIIDGVRTAVGSIGGQLSEVRADDMAAHVIAAQEHPRLEREDIAGLNERALGRVHPMPERAEELFGLVRDHLSRLGHKPTKREAQLALTQESEAAGHVGDTGHEPVATFDFVSINSHF